MKSFSLIAITSASLQFCLVAMAADTALKVGVAETDITPPVGFPMAGYYHERLAEGTIDPLKARAIVFRGTREQAAWVVCDIIGISADLSKEVRQRVNEKTGIPVANMVVSATHTHTAPDYTKELVKYLEKIPQDPARAAYIEKLIGNTADAVIQAYAKAEPAEVQAGSAVQQVPVSFNRRFVMKDGSVRTWMNLQNPDVVRAAGPIDTEIGLLSIRSSTGAPRGVISNFALHLDTVGGMKWSADYPHFVEQVVRKSAGQDVISLFGTGCCGDINHADPTRPERNKVNVIGTAIGESVAGQLGKLRTIDSADLRVRSRVVPLPLQEVTREEIGEAIKVLDMARRKEKVEFLDHVTAYKRLMLDHLGHREPFVHAEDHITWGLSKTWAGVGNRLPVEVTVMAVGTDAAIVFLPGEVFVDLGLAIKRASPFKTTLVVELSNCVETIYIPHRAAYAGGSYEVTNSMTQPGSGEMLVEAAASLLREAASAALAH